MHFTSSDAQALLPADYTFTGAENGVATFGGVTLKTAAASQTVTVTDIGMAKAGTSNSITVTPAAATAFTVTNPSSSIAGAPFDLTVTAKDQFNNVASSYSGTVHFTSSDPHAGITLPSDFTFQAADNGSHTFSGGSALQTAGNQSVTVTDTVTAAITGTSGSINITPAAATVFSLSRSGQRRRGRPLHDHRDGTGYLRQHRHQLHRDGAFHRH